MSCVTHGLIISNVAESLATKQRRNMVSSYESFQHKNLLACNASVNCVYNFMLCPLGGTAIAVTLSCVLQPRMVFSSFFYSLVNSYVPEHCVTICVTMCVYSTAWVIVLVNILYFYLELSFFLSLVIYRAAVVQR